MPAALQLPLAVAVALVVGAGCVGNDYDAVVEARHALEECRRAHSGQPDACAPLEAELEARFERYERNAQRAWGCENTPEGCAPR